MTSESFCFSILQAHHDWLVVSNICYIFYIIYGHVILPIDELIFFKMRIAPPTRYIRNISVTSRITLRIARQHRSSKSRETVAGTTVPI